ncbi:MAG: hypothetical protein IT212_05970 [Bacteroidia bacterium]|nr:hypothetical protein [Bacteroidia bacterium]
MELKKAKSMINEMLEICSQLDEPTLADAAEGIYRDVQASKTIELIISYAGELMVFVNEAPWEDFGMNELRNDIEVIYNELLESYQDFE